MMPSDDGKTNALIRTPVETVVDLSPTTLRRALGHFCSGITIISSVVGNQPVGLTCQSFFSVSLDPPLVAFSVSTTSTSFPQIQSVGECTINVLSDNQHELSNAFSRSGTNKWLNVEWKPGRNGHPILPSALAWFECTIETITLSGDHYLVVARDRKSVV